MKVSIVIPTKNNADTLEKCLDSIRSLDYPEDELEIIVIDGYSVDGTVKIANKYGCRLFFENGNTISYARNIGQKKARGEFVAFTDADCIVDKNWIKELIKHFKDERIASVGGPNITPEDDTDFGRSIGIVLSLLSKVGARYGISGGKVREVNHNPTCNVMYRKNVLEEIGGFNPKLITADDEELDYRIRKKGYKILYTPSALVYHYRRPSWKKFMKMAWNYGLGRMQAIKIHREMGKWFHFLPSSVIILTLFLTSLSYFNRLFLWIAFYTLVAAGTSIALMSAYISIKYKRNNFLTIYGLITTWCLLWGLGFLRGVFK